MNTIKTLALFMLATILFSCQQSEESTQNVIEKKITIGFKGQEYPLQYQIIDGIISNPTLTPELEALRSQGNLTLVANTENELVLLDPKDYRNYLKNKTSNVRSNDIESILDANDKLFSIIDPSNFNHAGYIATDLDAYKAYFDVFGIKYCFYVPQLKEVVYYDENGTLPYQADVMFGFNNGLQYELVVVDPAYDNLFTKFINEGNSGIHHYGFSITDIDSKRTQLENAGFKFVVSGKFVTNSGLQTNLSFYDTRDVIGAYTEIAEAKLLGFNVSQNEGLLITGLFLGDVKLKCK